MCVPINESKQIRNEQIENRQTNKCVCEERRSGCAERGRECAIQGKKKIERGEGERDGR